MWLAPPLRTVVAAVEVHEARARQPTDTLELDNNNRF